MSVARVLGQMRGRGYKATPQRTSIVEAIAAEQHQSFEEIHARCPEVGMVTVYRTLDMLAQIGALRRLDLGDGPRYELAEAHHHHLLCQDCGSIAEFERCPIDAEILAEMDFEVTSHSLEIYGRCGDCR